MCVGGGGGSAHVLPTYLERVHLVQVRCFWVSPHNSEDHPETPHAHDPHHPEMLGILRECEQQSGLTLVHGWDCEGGEARLLVHTQNRQHCKISTTARLAQGSGIFRENKCQGIQQLIMDATNSFLNTSAEKREVRAMVPQKVLASKDKQCQWHWHCQCAVRSAVPTGVLCPRVRAHNHEPSFQAIAPIHVSDIEKSNGKVCFPTTTQRGEEWGRR